MKKKNSVVLAYSGGLDTSVAIKWIQEKYNMDVITLTVNLGGVDDLDAIKEKALKTGAIKAIAIDARKVFIDYFILPALQAGALYERVYPLATALGRPLIAKLLADVAVNEGADAVAHGSTGKGNDQVRFDVSLQVLAPQLKIIAPLREWNMSRNDAIDYANKHNIPISVKAKNPFSIDENLWGRSIECGVLEDPWLEPPEEAFKWTSSITDSPQEAEYLEITFEHGIPVSINGEKYESIDLIENLNKIAGKHGVGRIDHLENRLVGIKSREIYEAPAAIVLHKAHKALESMVMSKDSLRFKDIVSGCYADNVYNGLWFSPFHGDLAAFVASSQQVISGTIRVKLSKGNCMVVGRKSDLSLYSHSLSTYDNTDTFDHNAATGFIKIYGLPLKIQAKQQFGVLKTSIIQNANPILPPKITYDD
ncbi:MAG: argininosuccinate synthase [Candidatus Anammoxibacter sp.]